LHERHCPVRLTNRQATIVLVHGAFLDPGVQAYAFTFG